MLLAGLCVGRNRVEDSDSDAATTDDEGGDGYDDDGQCRLPAHPTERRGWGWGCNREGQRDGQAQRERHADGQTDTDTDAETETERSPLWLLTFPLARPWLSTPSKFQCSVPC